MNVSNYFWYLNCLFYLFILNLTLNIHLFDIRYILSYFILAVNYLSCLSILSLHTICTSFFFFVGGGGYVLYWLIKNKSEKIHDWRSSSNLNQIIHDMCFDVSIWMIRKPLFRSESKDLQTRYNLSSF